MNVYFRRLRRPALYLVFLAASATVFAVLVPTTLAGEPPYLLLSLNAIFIGIPAFFIAAIASRGFLRTGAWPVLWLGAGTLSYGTAMLLGSLLIEKASPNTAITVHNLQCLAAASLYLLGAFFVINEVPDKEKIRGRLSVVLQVYVGTLAFLTFVAIAGIRELLPPFFIHQDGGSPLRQLIVGASAVFFFLAGLSIFGRYRKTGSAILYWFSLALVLISLGMIGILFQSAMGTLLNWMGRGAQMLGGLYLLVASLATLKEAREQKVSAGEAMANLVAQMKEQLRESEERYRRLEETANEGIWILDPEFRSTYVNKKMAEMLGYSPEEIIGKKPFHFMDEKDVAIVSPDFERRQIGIRKAQELRFLRKDGSILWTLSSATPIQEKNGKLAGTLSMLVDITERKRAEEQVSRLNIELEQRVRDRTHQLARATQLLQESDAQFRRLFDSNMIGIAFADKYGGFSKGNDEFLRIIGYDREDLEAGMVRWDRMTPLQYAGIDMEHLAEAGRRGSCTPYEKEYIRKDGSPVHIFIGYALLPESADQYIAFFLDISERKKAEGSLLEYSEQLRRLASELTMAEQRERQRLSQVLHDGLQQVLVGAKFKLAMVERGKNVRLAVAEISDLIDDAIETSRSLAAELSPPVLYKGHLLPSLEWLVRWMNEKHGLMVNLIARDKMDPVPEDMTVLLFQATRELLLNVVKHSGVRAARVHVIQRDGHIQMEVEDDGAGFDPNQLRHEGGHRGGTGLFSIRERIGLLGGRMEIDSSPGNGSRLKLSIPLFAATNGTAVSPDADRPQISVAMPQHATGTNGADAGIRVVLVDDHMVMRQGLAGMLQSESGIEVIGEASDGESAIRLIRDMRPDVVLMDISMPGLDGIQATRIIHEEMPEVRIIGLSMFEEGEKSAAMREAGAVACLTKTAPIQSVITAIHNFAPQ